MTAEQPSVAGSLAVQYPEVACEWDSELNHPLTANMITPGSKRKVGWVCRTCQHKWQAQVSNRAAGASCKKCATKAMTIPKPGNSLADRNPAVAAEWHPTRNGDLRPADVAFSRKAKAWWLCATCPAGTSGKRPSVIAQKGQDVHCAVMPL